MFSFYFWHFFTTYGTKHTKTIEIYPLHSVMSLKFIQHPNQGFTYDATPNQTKATSFVLTPISLLGAIQNAE